MKDIKYLCVSRVEYSEDAVYSTRGKSQIRTVFEADLIREKAMLDTAKAVYQICERQ